MSKAVRWTPEQLAEYEARIKKTHAVPIIEIPYKAPPKESQLERRFDQQILEAGILPPQKEWFFMLNRDFRIDRAWPDRKLGVEIQGMSHRIKGKFKADIEKRALAMLAGWRILEVDGSSIKDGRAIEWTKQLLA